MIADHFAQFFSAYLVYLVAVISPGPANMAIISTAISQGRKAGLVIALGIFAGSFTWAMAASFGLAALLHHYGQALILLKIAGGLYLFYLAIKAAVSALRKQQPAGEQVEAFKRARYRSIFLRGYLIHLTNPKAIFGWLAIISLGVPVDASLGSVVLVVGGCLTTGFTVFCGYALVFSTTRAVQVYRASRRYVDGVLALLFGAAGVKMLTTSL
ncbi:LysE family translocator [Agrobacterium vitis]|uniref:LysE family translocator n=1 Tax=Agrobacterium vitis TaxID=373 RepID=A0AAE4WD58_AGRVI|nr:LysE family translocator [Agrobacterium vitis]MCF1498276.1 LysE family translocator [Allorhizobium sp. Av2]MCM2440403.1 LysE family translocator [Agrobacterium vitis]MUZ58199.1 LysE family translocator [Agrobacterium vitis]MVA66161.1 LysE family translocator [Agrobacterium vitis]MVA87079.1 LysE family translocator [Agrobacterium vitis]